MSSPSSLSVSQAIRAHNAALTNLYFHHRETVLHIQDTLLTQILPNVLDELALGRHAHDSAQEWLQDDLFIFRTLKRHQFTKAFALESLRTILTWRLTHLRSQKQTVFLPSPLHILPPPASDIFRRPILILRLAELAALQRDPREHILRSVEELRLNLHNINSPSSPSESPTRDPVFQYVLLVDMEGVSMRKSNLDLLTWYAHEVAPRYPGLFGTVFIMNFSWTHSGIWSVIRLALPESVHYRIFFPSREVLYECISPSSLPQDYGGNLPRLSDLLDTTQHVIRTPLFSPLRPSPTDEDSSISLTHLPEECGANHARRRKITSFARVSPRSQFNPFYGYPVDPKSYSPAPSPLPYLRYGRRRKRDLLRTLVALWWEKWGSRVSWTFSLLFIFFCARRWWRQRRKSVFFIRGRPN